jgi:hypothetical protein
MNHLTRPNYVAYIDGVKIMHNPKHNETIFITSSAMNGVQLMAWKELHRDELRKVTRKRTRRA